MLSWLFNLWWNGPPALLYFSMTLEPPEEAPIPTTHCSSHATSLFVLHCGFWGFVVNRIPEMIWVKNKPPPNLPLPFCLPTAILCLFWRQIMLVSHVWHRSSIQWSLLGDSRLWRVGNRMLRGPYVKEGSCTFWAIFIYYRKKWSMSGASGCISKWFKSSLNFYSSEVEYPTNFPL